MAQEPVLILHLMECPSTQSEEPINISPSDLLAVLTTCCAAQRRLAHSNKTHSTSKYGQMP
jgi:hypothetical protein